MMVIVSRSPVLLLPVDFSLAETVLYELSSFTKQAEVYNEALKSSPLRLDVERKRDTLRRHVAALQTILSPYRSEVPSLAERQQAVAGPANLFVGELSQFADQITILMPIVGGILKVPAAIPLGISMSLSQLLEAIRSDNTRLTESHLAPVREAVKVAQESRISPDHTLAAPANAIYKVKFQNWLSGHPVAQLLLVILVASVPFAVAIYILGVVGTSFANDTLALLYMAFLAILVPAWVALRIRGPTRTSGG
jgi:hypothetical protein